MHAASDVQIPKLSEPLRKDHYDAQEVHAALSSHVIRHLHSTPFYTIPRAALIAPRIYDRGIHLSILKADRQVLWYLDPEYVLVLIM